MVATIELHAGSVDGFLTEFRQVVPLVLREEGCLEYAPAVDVPTQLAAQVKLRPDVITVVEKWRDLECLEAHLIAPHMLAYRERVKGFVKHVQLQVLRPT